jgi:hypothetical protein
MTLSTTVLSFLSSRTIIQVTLNQVKQNLISDGKRVSVLVSYIIEIIFWSAVKTSLRGTQVLYGIEGLYYHVVEAVGFALVQLADVSLP